MKKNKIIEILFKVTVAYFLYAILCYTYSVTSITPWQDWVRMRWVIDSFTNWPPSLNDFWRVENGVFKSPFMFVVSYINLNLFRWDHRLECCFYLIFKVLSLSFLFSWIRNTLSDKSLINWLFILLIVSMVFSFSQFDNYLLSAGAYSFAVAAAILLLYTKLCAALVTRKIKHLFSFLIVLFVNTTFISSSYTIPAIIAIPVAVTYLALAYRNKIGFIKNLPYAFISCLFSILSLSAYVYMPPIQSQGSIIDNLNFIKIFEYFIALLPGGIFHSGTDSAKLALASGFIVFLTYTHILVHGLAKGTIRIRQTLPVCLIIFSVVNAAVIAVGRFDVGIGSATAGRYTTFQMFGIIGCMMYWMMNDKKIAHLNKINSIYIKNTILCIALLGLLFLIGRTARSELSIMPYRIKYFDALDKAINSNAISEKEIKLFNADNDSNVVPYINKIKSKSLGSFLNDE